MFIQAPEISVDVPPHTLSRAAERFGLTGSRVREVWDEIATSRSGDLISIPVGESARIIHHYPADACWVVHRYSTTAIRVMTVVQR